MDTLVKVVGRAELDDCSAAVSVDNEGITTFFTNRDVFPTLSRQEQFFILAHELGHRLMDTGDEHVADAFALGLTAGRQYRSLKSAISSLTGLRNVPVSRIAALLDLCKQIDIKKQIFMKKQHTLFSDGSVQTAIEPAPVVSPNDSKMAAEQALMIGQLLSGNSLCRRPGVHIGNWFFSAELMILTAILVATVTIASRIK